MQVPELGTRHAKSRLHYMAKIMAMQRDRLAQTVVTLAPQPAVALSLGRVQHWWTVINEFIAKDLDLAAAFRRLRNASERNQKVVPHGIDPTLTDFDYFPIKSWRRSVKWWARSSTLTMFVKTRGSSTKLLRRAIVEGDSRIPRFRLTWRANWGPDQIRLRLLAGTSGLNATLSKYADRASTCPFDSCEGGVEDVVHFLLHCKGLDGPRATFRERLWDRCTCDRRLGSGGVPG